MQGMLPRDPTLNVAGAPLNEQHSTTKSTPTKLNCKLLDLRQDRLLAFASIECYDLPCGNFDGNH